MKFDCTVQDVSFHFTQVNMVVEIAGKAVADGKCCVIGLQSTGESVQEMMSDSDTKEVPSTAAGCLISFLRKHCNFLPSKQVSPINLSCLLQ